MRKLHFSLPARTHCLVLAGAIFLGLGSSRATAQSTEERFQDLFVTAGYATAFGAALGAAMLSFVSDPASELRYVAYGASLGFIGGSVMGTYVIFSPMLSLENQNKENDGAIVAQGSSSGPAKNGDSRFLASNQPQTYRPGLRITPAIDRISGRMESLTGTLTIATF